MLKGSLCLIIWQKGDRMIPLGMKDQKKISDILIDQIGDSGGWGYGMNSIEAMTLGLCCMTQMNDTCNKFFENRGVA